MSVAIDSFIDELNLIDTHAHPFNPSLKRISNEQLSMLLAIGSPEYESSSVSHVSDLKELLLYKFIIKELARLLNVKNDENSIINKRNSLAENFKNYVEILLNDAKIAGFVFDDGYSEAKGEHALPHINIYDFKELLPKNMKLKFLHRIEPDIKNCFEKASDFESFIREIEDIVDSYIKNPEYAGFKTIIAYRTGLDIKLRSEEEAKNEFRRYKKGEGERKWFGPELKITREYVVSLIIEKISKSSKVLQIHTGIGDKDIVLNKSFPYLLFDLLKEERVRNAKIILVHGGYPNVVFASYLANAFPNVFMDISIATPFGLANLENRIKEAIELAPASKVMYASDGYYIPELHWAGAILFKKALKRVLNDLINTYKFDEDDALRVARMIAYENAERVYGML